MLLVGQFVKENNLTTPFKDGVPGEAKFKKKDQLIHKEITKLQLLPRNNSNY